jgi:hypothetical protein
VQFLVFWKMAFLVALSRLAEMARWRETALYDAREEKTCENELVFV